MTSFVAVDHDPFAPAGSSPSGAGRGAPRFVPVDHDPFAAVSPQAPPTGFATREQREGGNMREAEYFADAVRTRVQQDQTSPMGRLDAYARGVASWVPGMNKLAAAGDAVFGAGEGEKFGDRYSDNLMRQRAMDTADEALFPGSRLAGQTGGFAATAAILPTVNAMKAPGAVAGGVNGALTGALYSGVERGVEADGSWGDKAQAGAGGALTGALVGAPLGAAAGALGGRFAAPPAVVGTDVAQAAGRLGVDVPTAIATDSTAAQRVGQLIRNVPVVGDAIPKATNRTLEQLAGSVDDVARSYGGGSGPNAAGRVGRVLSDVAEAEATAARTAAQQADEAAAQAFETGRTNALGRIDGMERQAFQRAQSSTGNLNPQDTGAALIQRLRTGEEAARTAKDQLYARASQPGGASIRSDSVGTVSSRVGQVLENEGRPVDSILTPAASRMLDELVRFSNLNLPNKAVGARLPSAGDEAIVGVDMNGIEFVRKRLNGLSRAASNDADRSASNRIVREFDNWLDDAFDNALYSGSDEALQAFRQARAANRTWRENFGYNARDDADKLINRVVTGEITPQEMANWIVGSTKVGAQGVSSRLLTRIAQATGDDAATMTAIRGGVWNRLTQTVDGVDGRAPQKVANDIYEFINGSGRDVARRIYSDAQRGVMQAYADTLRRAGTMREAVADYAKANAPKPTKVNIGPMQELARTVLGQGGKADEAVYSTIDAYAKSGGRGDVQTLASLIKILPETERGNLAAAMISRLGVSNRNGQWTPDAFLTQWRAYTPQAKAILFGNAGRHRTALDDIATIAQRLQDVGKRFGNPSGTAQQVNAGGFVAWALTEPVSALSTAIGGAAAARVLANPATASSMARWSRVYELAVTKPTAGTAAALQGATRNLSLTIGDRLGIAVAPQEIIKAIAGPGLRSSAASEQNPGNNE